MAKKIRMVDEVEEAAMERDARRYRYIRDNGTVIFDGGGGFAHGANNIDALVDRLQEEGRK